MNQADIKIGFQFKISSATTHTLVGIRNIILYHTALLCETLCLSALVAKS